MTSTVNPLQLSLGNTSYQYRPRFINSESSVAGMDEVMADASPSPTSNLPGRLTRSATAHASNKSLPRIDTEQLRSLSLRDKVSGRRANRPSSAAVELRQQQFQKYREMLWENGRTNLGKKDTPHVKIAPVRLPTSPAPNYDSITIYTVVHSQGHSPVGLRRKFDRSLVTTTVPEPLQSPATPNFDRDELLSAIADTNKTLTAARRLKKNTRSSSVRRESRRQETPSPVPDGIPMHLPYARAHLPILASIIMSKQVRVGDTIELPLPHPEAWAETVAWVYIGEEELATPKVRDNVQYLGGRVC